MKRLSIRSRPSTSLPPTETATEVPSPAESATERPSPTAPPTSPRTDTSRPPTATPAPQVLSFTADPTNTQNLGDAVHLAWKANGQRAELCPLIGTGPTSCQDVPLAGERNLVVDEQGFQVVHRTVGLELKPGASKDKRVGDDPTPALFEPVSLFGIVWRGEVEWPYGDEVRERLGWATALESGYDTAYQCSTPSYPRLWNCFLLGPGGEVFHPRPDSTAEVRILWEEW